MKKTWNKKTVSKRLASGRTVSKKMVCLFLIFILCSIQAGCKKDGPTQIYFDGKHNSQESEAAATTDSESMTDMQSMADTQSGTDTQSMAENQSTADNQSTTDTKSAADISDVNPDAAGGNEINSEANPKTPSAKSSKAGRPAMVLDPKDGPAMSLITEDGSDSIKEETPDENDFHGYIVSEEEKNDPRVRLMETATEGRVIMDFAGDINFDEHYSNMATYKASGGISGVLSENLMAELNGADIFMINNEFPYSDRGTPTAGKKFTFRARPVMVENLTKMGADIVGLANNHAYDHGPDALMDTFDILDGADIPYVGAGRNIDEACSPMYFIAGGMKIAYVAATQIERGSTPDTKEATETTPGVLRTLDPTRFLGVIQEADQNADLTVVFVHWGSENTYDIDASQRELAQKYAAAGADLIVGMHSHCLQGFEYVSGVPVLYSLGNFWFSSKDLDSGVLQVVAADKKIESVRFIPCVQKSCHTTMYEKGSSEYDRLLGAMTTLSYDVSIDEDGYVTDGAGTGVAPGPTKPLGKKSY